MATLTRTTLSLNGSVSFGAADATAVAVASQDQVTNVDGRTLLYITNQGGSTDTVTIPVQNSAQYTASGVPVNPSAISVALATTVRAVLGPFSPSVYNDASGNIQIQHSFTTSVKCLAFHLPLVF